LVHPTTLLPFPTRRSSDLLIIGGTSPWLATLAGTGAGLVAGAITGLLHTKGRINALLAGILTQIGLYSINLRIMGAPNLPLLRRSQEHTSELQSRFDLV